MLSCTEATAPFGDSVWLVLSCTEATALCGDSVWLLLSCTEATAPFGDSVWLLLSCIEATAPCGDSGWLLLSCIEATAPMHLACLFTTGILVVGTSTNSALNWLIGRRGADGKYSGTEKLVTRVSLSALTVEVSMALPSYNSTPPVPITTTFTTAHRRSLSPLHSQQHTAGPYHDHLHNSPTLSHIPTFTVLGLQNSEVVLVRYMP